MTGRRIDVHKPTLPVGTVTFLFTDIESSSRIWEQDDPDTVGKSIARHYEILDDVIARHGGVRPVEQGEGDSVVGVFARALDAVAAVVDAQIVLRAEPWLTTEPLRVRMAVHSGEALMRDEVNYTGPVLNRCARLRELAHGGQVLISGATQSLVPDDLPPGVALKDLGTHRLRDLGRPEDVYQLCHPELSADFPPLRSLDARPHNLPSQVTSFIGREQEMVALRDLLGANRLLTLVGSGGCGKTRLALQVAASVTDDFAAGVWWVDLAALSDPDLVPNAIGAAMGIREVPGESFTATLERVTADRQTLVLLDNCEHLIEACAGLCHALLRCCPRLVILATSREPLGVEGESMWRVPSLNVAEETEFLPQSESGQLFLDRSRRARPTFRITDENAAIVAQICRRLDGIPLAIELAAARIRVLTPEQIAAGLDDRFRLLGVGPRTAVPRQRTLEASVEWSYNLLEADQQTLFRRLSVFTGSFALDSAEAVCADDELDGHQVFDLLLQLVDRSLVQAEEDRPRYRLLETIRQYGRQKLVESGEADALRLRHLDHYGELVERAVPLIEGGATLEWMDRLHRDMDNLRAAMEWSLVAGHAAKGLRLVTAWPEYWSRIGHLAEIQARIGALLEATEEEPALLARAIVALANVASYLGDYETSVRHSERGRELARAAGDARLEARAALWAARSRMFGLHPEADDRCVEAIALAHDAADRWAEVYATTYLGIERYRSGDVRGGLVLLEDGVAAARASGELLSLAHAVGWLGIGSSFTAPREAESELREGLAIARSVGDRLFASILQSALGGVATMRGSYDEARSQLEEALADARESHNGPHIATSLNGLATLERALGNADAAANLADQAARNMPIGGRASGVVLWGSLTVGAWAAVQHGDLDRASTVLDGALRIADGAPVYLGEVLVAQALVARHRGDLAEAEELTRRAVAEVSTDLAPSIAEALEHLGRTLAVTGEHNDAVRLVGAADALRSRIGMVRFASDEAGYRADLDIARDALGEAAFAKAWHEGAGMSAAQAVADAMRGRSAAAGPPLA